MSAGRRSFSRRTSSRVATGMACRSSRCWPTSPAQVPSPARTAASNDSFSRSSGPTEFSMTSSMSGWRAMKSAMRGRSQAEAKSGETLSRSRRLASTPTSGDVARTSSPKARPVALAKARPVGVTSTARCARTNSAPPIAFSRLRMRWLIADGVRCRASAASLKLPNRTAASNACKDRSKVGFNRLAAGEVGPLAGSAARLRCGRP